MSGQRAADEPYTTRFETEVVAVDGRQVWLETSFFYAGGCGQPADRGTVGDVAVEAVRFEDGEHVHVLADEPRFGAGQRVLCSIDWAYRMYCMRAHTAAHVLYGAGRRLFDDLAYAGVTVDAETVTVDLETAHTVDDDALVELDRRLNEVVWQSRPVCWERVPAAEVRERDDVAFDERDRHDVSSSGCVRLVTVGAEDDRAANGSSDPWDVAACGGTHVRNTREIGPVTVLGRHRPADGVTRVEFAVGSQAIARREAEKRAAFAVETAFEADVSAIPDAVSRR
ncbi:alanyl-tRNA editing protein [Natronobiforma cellulositropha]|uniref:alanyl-tRNA editing protein n=1 Tax=Natronobiforma cellulositropha TaxID=1679076 RepID=UPI0021D5A3C2|nr:alanyl-tRNA editing protein [Natronobiforma cellulositropha]